MLIANRLPGGFGKDIRFEVTASGAAVSTINDSKSTFELDSRSFSIVTVAILGPTLHLKSGDTLIATATGKPLVNNYTLAFGGKEWTFKATSMMATKFGLLQNDNQIGEVSAGTFFSRQKNITADFPDELPREVQLFLLSIFIGRLTDTSS